MTDAFSRGTKDVSETIIVTHTMFFMLTVYTSFPGAV